MKCEKCGNNEAMFHYQSNINGEKTEYHLCGDCAKEEGFGELYERAANPAMAMSRFWGESMGMLNSFFNEPFFSPFMGRSVSAPALRQPWFNIFIGDGAQSEAPAKVEEKSADNIPEDAGSEFKKRRELCALRSQLKRAIHAEEFEKAAEIRDKIREMEQ